MLAERRKRKEEMQSEAEDRLTAQKRAEFLSLVRNGSNSFDPKSGFKMSSFVGLRAWRQQHEREKIASRIDDVKTESLGTQLGRSM